MAIELSPLTVMFDVDYTLFSPSQHRRLYIPAMVGQLGIDESRFKQAHEAHGKTLTNRSDYHHVDYLKFLSSNLRVPMDSLWGIYFDQNVFAKALFEDTKPALEALQGRFRIGAFTEGWEDLQGLKLSGTGISRFFDPGLVQIHRRKRTPEAIAAIPRGAVVIDDKSDVVNALFQRGDLKPVWINREGDSKHPKLPTVRDLNEFTGLLEDLNLKKSPKKIIPTEADYYQALIRRDYETARNLFKDPNVNGNWKADRYIREAHKCGVYDEGEQSLIAEKIPGISRAIDAS